MLFIRSTVISSFQTFTRARFNDSTVLNGFKHAAASRILQTEKTRSIQVYELATPELISLFHAVSLLLIKIQPFLL
jgi:hypothetical protein